MLKRKKKIIAKVMATTMLASTLASVYAPAASALEPRATVNSSTIAGNNRYETAIAVSKNGWTTSNNAVLINGEAGLVDALTATPYATLKNAPILITHKTKLTPATKQRLIDMKVKNVDIVGGAGVVAESVVSELKAMGITVQRLSGNTRYETATAVAKAMDKISDVSKITVVNGKTGLPDAVSVAAPAADNKMPILLADPNKGLPESAKKFIAEENISKSYVIGETGAVSNTIMNSLPGTKVRLGGARRQETNAKVISEFYTSKSLNNIYVAKSGQVQREDEVVDALAVGVLASKNDAPVMIVGKNLDTAQKSLLANKEFTKITQVGHGIPTASIDEIKATQADVEAKVTSVSMVNYKTIKLVGSDLDKLSASSVSISGNSVKSYTVNTAKTEATVEFNNAFANGTNTVKVTSNLGNAKTFTFTYTSEITSVQATTKEVGKSGVQYVEFTVNNGQKRSVDELKALGWAVEFKSTKEVFYNQTTPATPLKTSNNGKLITSFATIPNLDSVFDYEVILKKGSTELKSGKAAVTVVDKETEYKEIKSYDTTIEKTIESKKEDIKITSNRLVVDEEMSIQNIKATDLNNNEVAPLAYTLTSSRPSVAVVTNGGEKIKAISTGTSEITLKVGNMTKKFTITVTSEARKMNSVRLDSSSVKLVKGKDADVVATVKDQYGDPIIGKSLTLGSHDLKSGNTTIATASTSDGGKIRKTDKEGKVNITIHALTTVGDSSSSSATLYIRNEADTSNLTSMTVYVSKDSELSSAKSWKLNLADSKKDTTLDMYKREKDNTVELNFNSYNSGGYLLDLINDQLTVIDKTNELQDGEAFTIRTTNKEVATVDVTEKTEGEKKSKVITVAAGTKTGSATIEAYRGKTRVATISISVKDTTPKITSIDMNDLGTINKDKLNGDTAKVSIYDLINSTKFGDKIVVEGVSMTGTKGEILLEQIDNTVILFIDSKENPNGKYDKNDNELLLATIELISDCGTVSDDKPEVTITQGSDKITGSIIVKAYHGEHESGENPFMTNVISVDIPAKN